MSAMLTTIGEVVTSAMGWLGEVATTITSTPLLLLSLSVTFVGLAVGLVTRLCRGI